MGSAISSAAFSFFASRRNLTFCFVSDRRYGGSIRRIKASASCMIFELSEYQLKWSQNGPRILLSLALLNPGPHVAFADIHRHRAVIKNVDALPMYFSCSRNQIYVGEISSPHFAVHGNRVHLTSNGVTEASTESIKSSRAVSLEAWHRGYGFGIMKDNITLERRIDRRTSSFVASSTEEVV